MRVSAATLIAIANKLTELEKLDIQVTQFEMLHVVCTVESTDDQKEGRSYYLKDVNEKRQGI